MKTYYLDTNAIRCLAHDSAYHRSAESLKSLVRSGACQIFGSCELLEECVHLVKTDAPKYGSIIDLFWAIVEKRVLRPWQELVDLEASKRSRLSQHEACIDKALLNRLIPLSRDDPESCAQITRGVTEQQQSYADDMTVLGDDATRILSTQFGDQTHKLFSEWSIDESTVCDWLVDWRGHELGLSSANGEAHRLIRALPCTRAVISMWLATIRRHHADGKKHRPNDLHDFMHYVEGAMADCLVTNDRPFRATVKQIEWKRIETLALGEFCGRIAKM